MTLPRRWDIDDHPIRKARLRLGLSLDRLAKLAGVHRRHILRIEQWGASPTVATLSKLAPALATTVAALAGEIADGAGPP